MEKVQPDAVFSFAIDALKSGTSIEVLRSEIEAAYRLHLKLKHGLNQSGNQR